MTIRRKDSTPSQPRKLTSAEVRAKVIEEILNTERDYVKHLEDIIEVSNHYVMVSYSSYTCRLNLSYVLQIHQIPCSILT